MTVVFPEPMAARLHDAVEAGEYASTSEAVRDAVRLWSQHRDSLALERLQQGWDAGKASGGPGTLDVDQLRRQGRCG
ncbi:type II toxin-antitoxin system ParD family antitoxin [Methylobacterium sp. J-076]|uniref:ribbon-helix-helix domain-containing protein n=1 Tax=Methylobacterium sp. J-076 TaxID=2836655 RepID=UPI001FBBD7FE|nr:type II toxin-antitoxin system ParD family antitoxin [Methylobacterium sp. J-076]MCJ2014397.1 type II toxin-antitoxin system ParD family antitoxin [Methylobacterium sp. J-076]